MAPLNMKKIKGAFMLAASIVCLAGFFLATSLIRGAVSVPSGGPVVFSAALWFLLFIVFHLSYWVANAVVLTSCVALWLFLSPLISLIAMGLYVAGVTLLYGSLGKAALLLGIGLAAYLLRAFKAGLMIILALMTLHLFLTRGVVLTFTAFLLSCVSVDIVIYLASNRESSRSGHRGRRYPDGAEPAHEPDPAHPAPHSAHHSTRPWAECVDSCQLTTAEAEISRIMSLRERDHYATLALSRGAPLDPVAAKKAYHMRARLVHPDKATGCPQAGEAFQRVQAAYECLSDAGRRHDYDAQLAMDELTRNMRGGGWRTHGGGGHGPFGGGSPGAFGASSSVGGKRGYARTSGRGHEDGAEEYHGGGGGGLEIPVGCVRCGGAHMWVATMRSVRACRWCGDCRKYHGAQQGDGWSEQMARPVLMGLFSRTGPLACFCASQGTVYDVTEWYCCSGGVPVPNTHAPSFKGVACVGPSHLSGLPLAATSHGPPWRLHIASTGHEGWAMRGGRRIVRGSTLCGSFTAWVNPVRVNRSFP
eukprot:jgi/Mesvir1/637/Mv17254-RA.1